MNYKVVLISFILIFFILGTVSAEELNLTDTLADGNVKEIYVSDTGDDSNTGSSNSPYATIGKAISEVSASDDATIYISKGTFSSDGNGDFEINLNHISNGGNLKFIGAGANETILDGQNSLRFAKIGQNSNVTFKNITFINFKASNGGTLYSEGILTVDSCVFKDSYVSGTCGGAIYCKSEWTSELYVTNSEFISCSANGSPGYDRDFDGGGAICAENIYCVYLENNVFANTRCNSNLNGAAVNIHAFKRYSQKNYYTKSYIKGNKFINITNNEKSTDAGLFVYEVSHSDPSLCIKNTFISDNEFINCYNPSDEYSIVYLRTGKTLFENNTFINSTNDVGNIYLDTASTIDSLNFTIMNELNNISNYEINHGLHLSLDIIDDRGNIVKISQGGVSGSLISKDYTYSCTYIIEDKVLKFHFPNPGNYSLVLTFRGVDYNLTTIRAVYDETPVELWVSPNGFDGNNGTMDYPLMNIGHAIDVGFEKSFNVVIHLLEGTYVGEDNVELLISNRGSLQIIGENKDDVVIDGENTHWFVRSDTNVTIKNIKFINGYSDTNNLIASGIVSSGSLFLDNCTIDKSRADNNYILYKVSFNYLNYTNNVGIILAADVVNSYFENNTNPEVGDEIISSDLYGGIIRDVHYIANSTFINNSAKYGGVFWIDNDDVISLNNYYANNQAYDGGVFYLRPRNKFTSQNDTFINNHAVNNAVAGFSLDYTGNPNSPDFNIINGTFINNSAQKAGALVMQKGNIINSSFINNSADYGGAIVIISNNKKGVSSNGIIFENLTFINNSARVSGTDIYLSNEIDSKWYPNAKVYFALPLDITFDNLTTNHTSDYLAVSVQGPCGAIIGGSRVNFKINDETVGYSEIVNGSGRLRYSGFEDGEFVLSGDVDNMYQSVVNNAVITVNLINHISNMEVWVSNSGSDVNGDGSKNNPFKTIGHAIDESTRDCENVMVHIESGTYCGELNNALEISSYLNLTLKGENDTVIDGENNTWFIKVLRGNNKITISDLTIKNMGTDNRESRIINSISPITIDEGANLCLDNVLITSNHGGEAIIKNEGNLVIINSLITKNAFSIKALVSGGNVNVNNTSFIDNFGISGSFSCENLVINNSIIRNSFNFKCSYEWDGSEYFLITGPITSSSTIIRGGVYSLIEGDCVLENTLILNDGDNSSLKAVGLEGVTDLLVPAFSLERNVYMKNVSMINNYASPITVGETTQFQYTYLSVMGYSGLNIGREFTAIDCSFYNFKYLWVLNDAGNWNLMFDRCVFKNITQICRTHSVGTNSKWVFKNSVFLDVDLYFQRPNYFIPSNPTSTHPISHNNGINNIPYENNFWASNSKPVIRYADGEDIIFNYSPKNWIVLNNVSGVLKLQLTNGRTTKDYNGDLPLSINYALNNGEMVPVITVDGKSYPISFVDGDIKIDSSPIENAVLKPVVAKTLFTSDLTVTYADGAKFTAEFLYPWGDPLANTNVAFSINDMNFTALTDENGSVSFDINFNSGIYDVITTNPVSKQINVNTIVVNKIKPKLTAPNVSTVYNGGKYLTVNVNAPGTVTVVLNGKTITKTVDGNGQVKIPITLAPKTYTAVITYNGNTNYAKVSASATIKVTKATPKLIAKKATLKNKKYSITLKDNTNKAMKKVKVTLKVNGKTYKATTNAKGKATFKLTKLTKKGKYTAKVKFAGNKNFKGVTKSVKLTVKK